MNALNTTSLLLQSISRCLDLSNEIFILLVYWFKRNTVNLPKTQKATVKQGSGDSATITVQEIPVQEPGPDQILIKMDCSSLRASD